MAATVEQTQAATDLVEEPRVMDGQKFVRESWTSAALQTRLIMVYNELGQMSHYRTEDI